MKIYCTPEFYREFDKITSHKKYKGIRKDFIDYFFDKEINDLINGVRLNGASKNPFIKKRLKGSGGARIYYYVIISKEDLYLMFIHPKTGSLGSPNITEQTRNRILRDVLDCIKENDLYELVISVNELRFDKV